MKQIYVLMCFYYATTDSNLFSIISKLILIFFLLFFLVPISHTLACTVSSGHYRQKHRENFNKEKSQRIDKHRPSELKASNSRSGESKKVREKKQENAKQITGVNSLIFR